MITRYSREAGQTNEAVRLWTFQEQTQFQMPRNRLPVQFRVWPTHWIQCYCFACQFIVFPPIIIAQKRDLCPIHGKRHTFYRFRTRVQEACYHRVPITSTLTIYQRFVLLSDCLQFPALIRRMQRNVRLRPIKSGRC